MKIIETEIPNLVIQITRDGIFSGSRGDWVQLTIEKVNGNPIIKSTQPVNDLSLSNRLDALFINNQYEVHFNKSINRALKGQL